MTTTDATRLFLRELSHRDIRTVQELLEADDLPPAAGRRIITALTCNVRRADSRPPGEPR